jgi:hypothetical protein
VINGHQGISPLRFAPVEMTGVINGHQGIPRLRSAPLGMTGRGASRGKKGRRASPEALKKEERKANAFVRRTNTVKKANGLGGAEKKGKKLYICNSN